MLSLDPVAHVIALRATLEEIVDEANLTTTLMIRKGNPPFFRVRTRVCRLRGFANVEIWMYLHCLANGVPGSSITNAFVITVVVVLRFLVTFVNSVTS